MSHLMVMVIGDNPEEQLAPYHEFECTGVDDQYVVEVDITEQAQANYKGICTSDSCYTATSFLGFVLEYYNYNILPSEQSYSSASSDKYKYGYIRLNAAGEITAVIRRTNPNAEWDWYVLGGRWQSMLLGKDGKHYNQLKKGEIDFTAWRKQAVEEALVPFHKYAAIVDGRPVESMLDILTRCKDMDVSDAVLRKHAHDIYVEQPVIKDIVAVAQQENAFWYGDIVEEFCHFEQAPYEKKICELLCAYAYVQDSKWVASGKMGWWGISTGEVMTQEQWAAHMNQLVEELPDDTLISIYDCHI